MTMLALLLRHIRTTGKALLTYSATTTTSTRKEAKVAVDCIFHYIIDHIDERYVCSMFSLRQK